MIKNVNVDDDVKDLITRTGKDFRVCTSCYGPAVVTTDRKPAKASDMQIKVGDNTLYISKVQLMYINRVSMDMVYAPEYLDACPVTKSP
ncbi:MAG: hypothetical protein AB7E27_03440 [Candidatus Methanomethylophilaceae archaeon]